MACQPPASGWQPTGTKKLGRWQAVFCRRVPKCPGWLHRGCNWHSTWAFVSGVRGRCWLLLAVTSLSVTFINSIFIAARRGALHCLPCFHQCTRITHTYIACTPPKNREVHPNSVKDWINPPSLLPLSSCSVLLHKLPPTPGHAPISQWSEGQPLRPCHCTGQGPVWFHPV